MNPSLPAPRLLSPCGLLNVDKPAGLTSRRVVDVVARLARPAKAGHAGTLDPLATGVLVVCVGGASRLIQYVQRMPKRYVATFLLGRTSPTEDIEGEIVELPGAPIPAYDEILAAAQRFVGRIEQRPPAFSALKIGGRAAYTLARRGKQVELPPRPVDVYRIEVLAYEYPELRLEIECGGGTYVRSLGRDLAESLGTAAVMSALTRTAIGGFRLAEAVALDKLTGDNWQSSLQPPLRAVEYLPKVRLTDIEARRVRNGLMIELNTGRTVPDHDADADVWPQVAEVAAVDPAGQLVGILGPCGSGQWRPLRNLAVEQSGGQLSG